MLVFILVGTHCYYFGDRINVIYNFHTIETHEKCMIKIHGCFMYFLTCYLYINVEDAYE